MFCKLSMNCFISKLSVGKFFGVVRSGDGAGYFSVLGRPTNLGPVV